jgi:hypothetical protein
MSIYRVKTKVEGVFTSMDYFLEGKRILLSYDGDKTYSSTDLLDLDKTLKLQWIAVGLSFQEWTITLLIAQKKPDGTFDTEKKWTTSGEIPTTGGSQLYKEIDLSKLDANK